MTIMNMQMNIMNMHRCRLKMRNRNCVTAAGNGGEDGDGTEDQRV